MFPFRDCGARCIHYYSDNKNKKIQIVLYFWSLCYRFSLRIFVLTSWWRSIEYVFCICFISCGNIQPVFYFNQRRFHSQPSRYRIFVKIIYSLILICSKSEIVDNVYLSMSIFVSGQNQDPYVSTWRILFSENCELPNAVQIDIYSCPWIVFHPFFLFVCGICICYHQE